MTTSQNLIDNWEDLPLEKFNKEVFHLQRRIFSLLQNGNRNQMHQLQKLLINSFSAKCIAVAQVTEKNAGRNTAGVDGEKCLSARQKLNLVKSLRLNQPINQVRRVWIPKPGKDERRPLGIPTMRDRALQSLIALALEPEWEARFTSGMYGFRKGRSAHDAIANIRSSIQFSPKWVLDADIEKFFDRVDHQALIGKLNTFPQMQDAIGRILKAGILEGNVMTNPDEGTPQGGPLSPLLANIVLCGLETDLINECRQWRMSDGRKPKRMPVMAMYADDFVVLHKTHEIVERCRDYISAWLSKMGLRLHPEKTRICHTLSGETSSTGFNFLGHHIQQFITGKHAVKAAFKQVVTVIKPSREATNRIYQKVAKIVDETLGYRREKRKRASPEELLIIRLNPVIRGWCNYFRYSNAKRAFNRLDNILWWKLWKAMRRRHKGKSRYKTVETYFKKPGGKWQFCCPTNSDEEERELRSFDETPIVQYYQIEKLRRYYDGDWAYWGTRQGRYPALPARLGKLLKKQYGKCHTCKNKISRYDQIEIRSVEVTRGARSWRSNALTHSNCDNHLRRSNGSGETPAIDVARSPVR